MNDSSDFLCCPIDMCLILKKNMEKVNALGYILTNKDAFLKRLQSMKSKVYFGVYAFETNYKEILEIKSERTTLYKIKLNKFSAHMESKVEGEFYLMVNSKINSCIVLTQHDKNYLKNTIDLFFYYYFYPTINKITLTSSEIFQILENLEEKTQTNIMSERSSGKKLFGKLATIVKFEKKKPSPFRDVFNTARGQGLWVHWISIVSLNKNLLFKGDLSRDGSISLTSYDAHLINLLLSAMIKIENSRLHFFDNREIEPTSGSKPFVLEYGEDVFREIENVKRLASILYKIPDFSFSVIHGGNPHLYIYLKDNKTGSSYSLKTLGEKKIIITPQFNSSPTALSRLMTHIVDNFSEYRNIREVNFNAQ